MIIESLTVPKARIGSVIGPKGATLRTIQRRSGCKLEVDSDTGGIVITAGDNIKDPMILWKTRDVVRAIGRGFSPEKALKLFKEDLFFEFISLKDHGATTDKAIHRIRCRLIGKEGKARSTIEFYTKVQLSIQGHTAAFIGPYEGLQLAKEAVMRLILGDSHGTVFAFLEEKQRELSDRKHVIWAEQDPDEDKDFTWDGAKATRTDTK